MVEAFRFSHKSDRGKHYVRQARCFGAHTSNHDKDDPRLCQSFLDPSRSPSIVNFAALNFSVIVSEKQTVREDTPEGGKWPYPTLPRQNHYTSEQ
jgi:hypothetical protein